MDVFLGWTEQAWSFVLSRNVDDGKVQVKHERWYLWNTDILLFFLAKMRTTPLLPSVFHFRLNEPAAVFSKEIKVKNLIWPTTQHMTTLVDLETELRELIFFQKLSPQLCILRSQEEFGK